MLWIIHGSTGEYSDRTEWVVGYCFNKDHAEAVVRYYTALAREIKERVDQITEMAWDERRKLMALHPDPRFDCDYTGTSYYLSEAPEIKEENYV